MNIIFTILFLFISGTTYAQECTQPSCFQQKDKELTGLANTTSAADRVPWYIDANGNMDLAPFTAFGRSIVGAANAGEVNTILGVSLITTHPRVTVATLPASPTTNEVVVVTDALAASSCIVNGGTTNVTCQWTGTAWVAIGGGGGGGAVAGTDTQVQFNDSNIMAGDAGLTYDKASNVLTVTGDVIVAGQSVCQEDGTNCPSGGAPAFNTVTAGTNTDKLVIGTGGSLGVTGTGTITPQYTPSGNIAATTVQGAIAELDAEKQPLDADLTALANATNGMWARTGAGTGAARTITGVSGNISCTNGDGVAGNPTCDLGTTAVQTDQSNTYTTGTQSAAAATAWIAPSNAGSPTAAGSFNFNTSTLKPQMGNGTTTLVIANEAGNVATATALAANGSNSTLGTFCRGVDVSGNCEADDVAVSGSTTPSAGNVEFAGQIYKDTRAYACDTGAGLSYIGSTAGGNFAAIGTETDGYTTISDGIDTSVPCGADTLRVSGSGGISFYQYNKTAAFTNQPTNDGWEAVSSNAGDTTQFLRVCGTLTGGTGRDLTCETIQLNGTTFISSVATTYADLYTMRLCTTVACVANTTAAGTITLREASGDAAITTITAGNSKAAHQDITVAVLSSTLNINGLTTDNVVDVAADYIPYYDAGEGANNKVLMENVGPRKIYWDAGAMSVDGTQCAAPTEQTLNSGPKTWAFSCADNNGSIFYGKVRLPVAVTTVIFTLGIFHATSEVISFAGDFAAQCRADGTAINNTYGTVQAADIATAAVANQYQEQATPALTPNGTCSKGAMLFWKYTVDATTADANAANSKILQVTMDY